MIDLHTVRFANAGIALYHADCMDVMPTMAEASVDCVLCDLPYGVLNRRNPAAAWDNTLPLPALWREYERIVKPNGAIILFAQGMFTANLLMSNPRIWRYNLVWDKILPTGFLNANRAPLRRHEDICVFYRHQPVYHPQMTPCPPHKRNHSSGKPTGRRKNRCYGKFVEKPSIIADEKFPTSIITIPKKHKRGEWYHPTEKPVPLLEWLLRTYTDSGDLVLDNTMGSGSTILACANLGRRAVGIEMEKDYFDIAVSRLRSRLDDPSFRQKTLQFTPPHLYDENDDTRTHYAD